MFRRILYCASVCLLGLSGCAAPMIDEAAKLDAELGESVESANLPERKSKSKSDALSRGEPAAKLRQPGTAETTAEKSKTLSNSDASTNADEALIEMLTELRRSGAIDLSTQQQIVKDWQAANPALRPQLLEMYRASLAYRKEAAAEPATSNAAEKSIQNGASNISAEQPAATKTPLQSDKREIVESAAGAISRTASIQQSIQSSSEVATAKNQTPQPLTDKSAAHQPTQVEPAKSVTFQANAKGSLAAVTSAAALQRPPTISQPTSDQPPAVEPEKVNVAAPSIAQTEPASPIQTGSPATSATLAARSAAQASGSWEDHLTNTIYALESELSDAPTSTADVGRHAGLRLLYLLDGRRADALRPIDGLPPSQQDFWTEELYGLAAYMDPERHADGTRRAAEASHHFREALSRLSGLAKLEVRNLTLCTDVKSYGVYEPFEKNIYKPGQEVLIYAEVENFASEPVDNGFKIGLRSSYQILDANGARVAKHEFPAVTSECKATRRDLFVSYSIFLPQRIYGGKYTLQFTVEDLQSQKLGSSIVELEIEEK
jgi:hypothetical protein